MTLGEFKAFIEGMDVSKAPTEKQWALITEKMATLEVISVPNYTPPIYPGSLPGSYIPFTTCEATQ